ncbi:hypothetical protein GYB22_04735 [bacterium]|nr:hypothetical protein [bacterium]
MKKVLFCFVAISFLGNFAVAFSFSERGVPIFQKAHQNDYLGLYEPIPNESLTKDHPSFYLVHGGDSSKIIKIPDEAQVTIRVRESVNIYGTRKSGNARVYGYILDVVNDSIVLGVSRKYIDLELYEGQETTVIIEYPYSDLKTEYYGLDEFGSISFSTPANNFWLGLGSTLYVGGLATTLLAAPLVSINYKNGDFNKRRYYIWALSGFASITVGIPLAIIGGEKSYDLVEPKYKNSYQWYIQKR